MTTRSFTVRDNRRCIDTVWYPDTDTPDDVRRSLIDHDGYPSTITVSRGPVPKDSHATWGADLLLANYEPAYRRAMAAVHGRIDRPRPTPEQVAPRLRAIWLAHFPYATRAEYGSTRAVDWLEIARDWCAERDLQASAIRSAADADPGELAEWIDAR